jgi:hypothetical protein
MCLRPAPLFGIGEHCLLALQLSVPRFRLCPFLPPNGPLLRQTETKCRFGMSCCWCFQCSRRSPRSLSDSSACCFAVFDHAPYCCVFAPWFSWSLSSFHFTSAAAFAFARLAERSKPLIGAIRAYEQKHGRPPESLAALVPDFLAHVPPTGMGAYPDYRYKVPTNNYEGNPWVLYVSTPSALTSISLCISRSPTIQSSATAVGSNESVIGPTSTSSIPARL